MNIYFRKTITHTDGTNIVDSVANVSPIQLGVEYASKRV